MGRVMQLASLSMAEVTYATGDISYLVQEQAKLASFRVKARQDNVSGVVLPAFEVDRIGGSGTLDAPYLHVAKLHDALKTSTLLVWAGEANKC
jgi:vacuolar-type H+-ATPase subunit D/Vma8